MKEKGHPIPSVKFSASSERGEIRAISRSGLLFPGKDGILLAGPFEVTLDCFIGYTRQTDIRELTRSLEAWDGIDQCEPAAIECPEKKYELFRRMAAENMAEGDYFLADIGFIPTYPDIVLYAERLLKENPRVGMFTMNNGVHICRKGVVNKWPERKSKFYLQEHARAYLLKGFQVEPCPQVYCRRISVS